MFRHLTEQPFVAATGIAALVHSTWSLATLFSGPEPYPQFSFAWFSWVLPALMISFALDVGQIATSSEIRRGHRQRGKYAAFGVFAVATYYLQFLYLAHHIPALGFGAGVAATWAKAAEALRDLSVWILPALLPLSTLLYTFSAERVAATEAITPAITIEEPLTPEPVAAPTQASSTLPADPEPVQAIAGGRFKATCSACGWATVKDDERTAKAALSGHRARCKGLALLPSSSAVPVTFSANGQGTPDEARPELLDQ